MDKNFNFNRIGKRMPYTTPEGFWDDLEKQIWERIKDEKTSAGTQEIFTPLFIGEKTEQSKPKHTHHLLYAMAGGLVAASIALLLIFKIYPAHHTNQTTSDFGTVERAFSKLSSADKNYLYTVYQDDLLINE